MFHWRDFWQQPSKEDEDLNKELRAHLELEAEELQESGADPTDARYAAQRALGNTTLVKEDVRALSPWAWLETVIQDARYGLRQLRRSPGFTVVAVLTLALGIGANTAIFSLVHAILLKPLPVSHPEQLYNLGDDSDCCSLRGGQDSFTLFSHPLYKEIRHHTPEFSEIAAFQSWLRNVSVRRGGASGVAEPFRAEFVSGNYFNMFGVGAFAGRTLTPFDDERGAPPSAVMNYRAWQVHFAADPSVVGSTLIIDNQPLTIVGVGAPSFFGDTLRGDPPDLWLPLAAEPAIVNRISPQLDEADVYWLFAIGRLQPGVRPAQAQAHLLSQIQHWIAGRPNRSGYTARELEKMHLALTPAAGGVRDLQASYAVGLQFLMVVSGFVLLIACANIANLLLARAAASRLQIAVRVALGASRARLMRQMLTEGLLLALLGGAAGVLLAFVGTRAILLVAFRGAEYVPIDPRPSLPVLAFALGLSILTGVIFSVAPAWIASHARPLEPLRVAGRSTMDRSTPQKSLLVLQATLSLVLLVGAGLATESLRRLEHQQFGFQTRGRLMVKVDSDLAGYSHERLANLYRELQERLMQIPGVVSASLSMYSPMEGSNWSDPISIAEHPAPPGAEIECPAYCSSLNSVSAHYFETIGTRLVRGRFIDERDTPSSRHVAVINEAFAHKYFPNEDPLGKHFGIDDATHAGDLEIVGVVEDAKYIDAREPAFVTAFVPLAQAQGNNANIFHDIQLLVAGSARNLQPVIQRMLASVDPNLTVIRAITFDEQVSRNFNSDRLVARLTTLYGLLALILACVGLYGVAAYTVARRTSEIGIRMALGATRGSIIGMMLRVAMSPIGLGLLIGLPLALAGGRAIASGLYGVKSYDPFVLGIAVFVLGVSSIIAAVIPARRAASIDPIQALRVE